MKNILNKLKNPINIIAIGLLGSVPAFIYSFFVDVYSWSDLPWWGVISASMIPAALVWFLCLITYDSIKGWLRKKK
jgi:hypothetical protein